jgi:transcriptional regulator with XRE-family HTH domain
MTYKDLNDRLIAVLRHRIRSGQLTERGLARATGISQPHIHNVLKGKRLLSAEAADEILRRLDLDLVELILSESRDFRWTDP